MKTFSRFFHSDAGGGVVLFLSAALALLTANSPLYGIYRNFFDGPTVFWINDLLMAVFFLMAGLEIKRECVSGALSTRTKAALPLIAAFCGMIVPALIYLLINRAQPINFNGWAIPSATDIAFALGVLALASSRVPASIKILLMAIAVMDDLGAILVIAIFYGGTLTTPFLIMALLATGALVALNRRKVAFAAPYIIMGLILWGALVKSGIHPTIGGVLLGFCIPMSRAKEWQDAITPWVVFGILPLFGFANAGVSLAGLDVSDLLHPVTLGIGLGLFLGKQIGIFGSIRALVAFKICPMPKGTNWAHIYGVSLLCGIGFTMALFIGGLAFPSAGMDAYIRLGVMGGSIVSGLLGYTVLHYAGSKRV